MKHISVSGCLFLCALMPMRIYFIKLYARLSNKGCFPSLPLCQIRWSNGFPLLIRVINSSAWHVGFASMCSCQMDQSRGCLCMWLQRQVKQIHSLLKNSNILCREVLPFLYKYIWIYLGFWKWVNCGRGSLWALLMVAGKTGGSESTKRTTPRSKPLLYIVATDNVS